MNQMVTVDQGDLIAILARQYNLSPEVFEKTIIATCFPVDPPATREEFLAGMQIARKLDLNPLVKELHFVRQRGGGVTAIIGVDGWSTLANRHPQFDGVEFDPVFTEPEDGKPSRPYSVTCRIYRKDRKYPTEITEYFAECFRPNSTAWGLTPMRFLRHRALGQCCRIAFGFAGVMEMEEFLRWQEQEAENAATLKRLQSPVRYEEDKSEPETKPVVETKAIEYGEAPPPPPPLKKTAKSKGKAKAKDKLDDDRAHLDAVVNDPDPLDEPAYLGALEDTMAACRDESNLAEVWDDHHQQLRGLSLETQRNAEHLFSVHAKRLVGTK